LTTLPGAKAILTRLPSSWAATVTPCTAASDPTEERTGCQVVSLTGAVVTVSGGWL